MKSLIWELSEIKEYGNWLNASWYLTKEKGKLLYIKQQKKGGLQNIIKENWDKKGWKLQSVIIKSAKNKIDKTEVQ